MRGVTRLVGRVRVYPEGLPRGVVRGRGEIDGNGVAGMRRLRHNVGRKKFSHCKTGLAQQMPRSAGAVVVTNNFNAHIFVVLNAD